MRIAFSKAFRELKYNYFTQESLQMLLERLVHAPEAGVVMRGLGGIRKIRAPDALHHTGARSGLRILYARPRSSSDGRSPA